MDWWCLSIFRDFSFEFDIISLKCIFLAAINTYIHTYTSQVVYLLLISTYLCSLALDIQWLFEGTDIKWRLVSHSSWLCSFVLFSSAKMLMLYFIFFWFMTYCKSYSFVIWGVRNGSYILRFPEESLKKSIFCVLYWLLHYHHNKFI